MPFSDGMMPVANRDVKNEGGGGRGNSDSIKKVTVHYSHFQCVCVTKFLKYLKILLH
jgi:hypothetical protein